MAEHDEPDLEPPQPDDHDDAIHSDSTPTHETEMEASGLGTDGAGTTLEELIATVDREVSGVTLPTTEAPVTTVETTRCLLFTLGETRYAARVGEVIEVTTPPEVTPVPNVPPWIRGVSNLRGEILAVLDLRLLSGRESVTTDTGRMLVSVGGDAMAGLIVDAVNGVTDIAMSSLATATASDEALGRATIGVHEHDERLVAVIDLANLLNGPELQPFGAES
ncbi:MAG: chemotaxis protein CheW [Acidobacteriota bacterium]